jgi:hypothetical protein
MLSHEPAGCFLLEALLVNSVSSKAAVGGRLATSYKE